MVGLNIIAVALPLAAAQIAPFANVTSSSLTNATSPPKYPSTWGEGLGDWADAYEKARAFVSQLTLLEKVNLTTGVGWQSEKCVSLCSISCRRNILTHFPGW
jgi:beta-glucosidase